MPRTHRFLPALLAAAIALVPCAPATAAPQDAAVVVVPPTPAEIEVRFQALHKEFIAAWARYQEALQAARAQNVPRRDWPAAPTKAFHARFDELAAAGNPGALRWCIDYVDSSGLDTRMARQRRVDLYRKLIAGFADEDWMVDVVAEVRRAQAANSIDIEAAANVCADVYAKTSNAKVKGQALYNEALICANGTTPALKEKAFALYDRVIAEFPGSDLASRAQGKVTQLKRLQVGLVAPDFATTDVDGVPFKLSDYRGKVVLLDFWGFW